MSQSSSSAIHGNPSLRYVRVRDTGKQVSRKGLHIDFGSSGLRIAHFHDHDGVHEHRIIMHGLTREEQEVNGIQSSAQISTTVYVHDDENETQGPPVYYYGNATHPERKRTSAKLLFYALAGKTAAMKGQHQQLQELEDEAKKRPGFHNILRQAIHAVFVQAFLNARHIIDTQDIIPGSRAVDTISATISAQWDLDYERLYGNFICNAFEEVFHYPIKRIVFHTEGQIGFHYLFHKIPFQGESERASIDRLLNLNGQTNVVLMVDIGGHATNTALMTVRRDALGHLALLQIKPDSARSGGTGAWAHELLALLKRKYEAERLKPMPTWMVNGLTDDFYSRVTDFSDTAKGDCLVTKDYKRGIEALPISMEEIMTTFHEAYKFTFPLLEEQFAQLKSYENRCELIRLVVAGGSSEHRLVRNFIETLCDKIGIDKPFYLSSLGGDRTFSRLSLGSSYAIATGPSVQEFATTASFGVMEKGKYIENGAQKTDWANEAWVMWANNGRTCHDIKFDCDGPEHEFMLVCQPDIPRRREIDQAIDTNNHMCYDLLHLKGLPAATVWLRFQLDVYAETIALSFYKALVGLGQAEYRKIGEFVTEVVVWPGSRVLSIFEPEAEYKARLEAVIAGLSRHFGHRHHGRQPRHGAAAEDDDGDFAGVIDNNGDDGDNDDRLGRLPRSQPRRRAAPSSFTLAEHNDGDDGDDGDDVD